MRYLAALALVTACSVSLPAAADPPAVAPPAAAPPATPPAPPAPPPLPSAKLGELGMALLLGGGGGALFAPLCFIASGTGGRVCAGVVIGTGAVAVVGAIPLLVLANRPGHVTVTATPRGVLVRGTF
jgi:hypothetical protein